MEYWRNRNSKSQIMESKVSVFPAAASLQTGSSTGFSTDGGFSVQVSVCIFSLS